MISKSDIHLDYVERYEHVDAVSGNRELPHIRHQHRPIIGYDVR